MIEYEPVLLETWNKSHSPYTEECHHATETEMPEQKNIILHDVLSWTCSESTYGSMWKGHPALGGQEVFIHKSNLNSHLQVD